MKPSKQGIKMLIIMAVTYVSSYYLPLLLLFGREGTLVTSGIDRAISAWSPSIFVYLLAYVQWIICAYITACQDEHTMKKVFIPTFVALIIGFAIFVAFPTYIERPVILGDSFTDKLLRQMYAVDASPYRALPSLHCMASTFAAIALYDCKNVGKTARIINIIFSFMVFASTLLTKQHSIYDVIVGTSLMAICLFIGRRKFASQE